MMNTLANHGFLPRDGHNITKDNAVAALGNGLNFDATLAGIMWEQALVANPEPNATFFTLDNLNRHNVLEHDASISRTDAYFGNNHVFNQTVFDTSKKYWTTEMLSAQQLANTKIFRQVESRSANPNYTFTAHTEPFSLGEMAAPLIVFGDMETALANRTFVEYFFGMILHNVPQHDEQVKLIYVRAYRERAPPLGARLVQEGRCRYPRPDYQNVRHHCQRDEPADC